jgi:hypothetical protein
MSRQQFSADVTGSAQFKYLPDSDSTRTLITVTQLMRLTFGSDQITSRVPHGALLVSLRWGRV